MKLKMKQKPLERRVSSNKKNPNPKLNLNQCSKKLSENPYRSSVAYNNADDYYNVVDNNANLCLPARLQLTMCKFAKHNNHKTTTKYIINE